MGKQKNDGMVEGKVRDYLAADITFIEAGLVLLEKEHYLKNAYGADGFIDILAKDAIGNYVVIEIKRSQQSSRQAIQELFKYIALLKQNYHARDGEIRCIIISTHWAELLVPFSELTYQTSLAVKGLKIELDLENRPVRKEVVEPISIAALKRQFSPAYIFNLFFTAEKGDQYLSALEIRCKEFGLKDFVILRLNVNTAPGKRVFYRYATCLAFQSLTTAVYLDLLKDSDELDKEADEFDDEAAFKYYLEECIQCELYMGDLTDSTEAGSPEKLEAELALENWFVDAIARHGIFALDPRFDTEMLVNEMRGLNGNNSVKYINICDSTHHDRLTEIRDSCKITLKDNANWEKHIDQIFTYLKSKNSPFRLIINIYSPPSVFDGLLRMMVEHPFDFMPQYVLIADFLDTNELIIFNGNSIWDGTAVDEDAVMNFIEDEEDVFMTKIIDCILGHHERKLLRLFHLKYQHTITRFAHGDLKDHHAFRFTGGSIKKVKGYFQTPLDWIVENDSLSKWIVKAARSCTNL